MDTPLAGSLAHEPHACLVGKDAVLWVCSAVMSAGLQCSSRLAGVCERHMEVHLHAESEGLVNCHPGCNQESALWRVMQ